MQPRIRTLCQLYLFLGSYQCCIEMAEQVESASWYLPWTCIPSFGWPSSGTSGYQVVSIHYWFWYTWLSLSIASSPNILIDGQDCAKLTDFGFALELPVVDDGRSLFTAQAFARSEGYYPSELTSGRYSAKSDVYSFGVVSVLCFPCGYCKQSTNFL